MRIRPAGALIALLIALNLALGYALLSRHRQQNIKADHIQLVHLNTKEGGTLYVTLGISDTPSGAVAINPQQAATLALTPRAAIQMHVELGRMIKTVQDAAAQREARRSPDRTL